MIQSMRVRWASMLHLHGQVLLQAISARNSTSQQEEALQTVQVTFLRLEAHLLKRLRHAFLAVFQELLLRVDLRAGEMSQECAPQ